jgi:hypothetical protein
MPKMKKFRYWFHVEGTGYIDIEAVNQEQADDLFDEKTDAELFTELDSINFENDDMEEIKR